MKTPEEFELQANNKGIIKWQIRECSICNYPLSYYFSNGQVTFDSGCDCTRLNNIRQSSWNDVADFFNMQEHPSLVEKMNQFWGFTS